MRRLVTGFPVLLDSIIREGTSLPGVPITWGPCSNISPPRALRAAEGSPPLHAMFLHGDTNGEAWVQPGPRSGDTAGFRLGSSSSPVMGPWTSCVPLGASLLPVCTAGSSVTCCLDAQSCLTLCSPRDCSPSAPRSVGFSRQYQNGLPFLSPGDLPDPGTEPVSSVCCDARRILTA